MSRYKAKNPTWQPINPILNQNINRRNWRNRSPKNLNTLLGRFERPIPVREKIKFIKNNSTRLQQRKLIKEKLKKKD